MGFFKKSLSSESKRTALTIIAKGNKISGEMSVTGKLHIDGCVEGGITSIENVSIGRTGEVKGKIAAKNVTVSGLIEGEIFCDHLHLSCGGRVVAKVECCELTMDAKSQFIGERQPLKLPDFQKMIALKNPVKSGGVLKPATLQENTEQEAATSQDFIDDLPDKITLAPMKSSDAQAVENDIVDADNSQLDEAVDKAKAPVLKKKLATRAQLKRTGSERRSEQRREADLLLDERSSRRNRAADTVTVEQSAKKRSGEIKNDADKDVEQLSRAKVTDENTTKLELKF